MPRVTPLISGQRPELFSVSGSPVPFLSKPLLRDLNAGTWLLHLSSKPLRCAASLCLFGGQDKCPHCPSHLWNRPIRPPLHKPPSPGAALEEAFPVHPVSLRRVLKRDVALSARQRRTKVRQGPVAAWQGEEAITREEGLTEQPWGSHSLASQCSHL